jgi:hypothetical protein
MEQVYTVDELRIVVNRTLSPKARWTVMTWPINPESDAVACGIADTYKLACAAAGEAFDRLTAPREERKPDIVRALREALRVYRECEAHDGASTGAMAAAIAAYETEKAKA